VNYFAQPWRSHSRGEVFSTNLPFSLSRLLSQGNSSQLTSSSLKGEEDLTGELFRSTMAFSLEGGGVLYEPTFPALETSNAREQFISALYKTFENILRSKFIRWPH